MSETEIFQSRILRAARQVQGTTCCARVARVDERVTPADVQRQEKWRYANFVIYLFVFIYISRIPIGKLSDGVYVRLDPFYEQLHPKVTRFLLA